MSKKVTEERIAEVKRFAEFGLSMSQTAKELGVSKNTVVGINTRYAHTHGIAFKNQRVEKIKSAKPVSPQKRKTVGVTQKKPTLPPQQKKMAQKPVRKDIEGKRPTSPPQHKKITPGPARKSMRAHPTFRKEDVVYRSPLSIVKSENDRCQWPIGEPGEEGFRWCPKDKELGSYCMEHWEMGHAPIPKKKMASGFPSLW